MMTFGLEPSLYLYVKSLIFREDKLPRPVFVYFAPLIVRVFIRTAIIIYALLWNNSTGSINITPMDLDYWDIVVAEPLSVMVFCIYLLLTFKLFRNFNKNRLSVVDNNQVQEEITAKWLKIFLHSMGVLAITWMATVLSPMIFNIEYGSHFY
jgi:hypothetical protein